MKTSSDAIGRFWRKYLDLLEKQGIKHNNKRWYLIRAENYIKAFPEKRLSKHTELDITSYLQRLGRSEKINEWQYKQAVVAIRILLRLSNNKYEHEIDWSYWLDSSISLSENHRSLARAKPLPDESFHNNKVLNIDQSVARERYKSLRAYLIREIRRRDYSISTEQTYESWILKFIAFNDNKDPLELGEDNVISFLEYLAISRKVAASTLRSGPRK